MKKPANPVPWSPVPYGIEDAGAIQALLRGDALPHQQQRALKWIIESAAGTYDQTFYPGGEDGRRNTDFAEGRRFVGSQIVKMTRLALGNLRRNDDVQANPVPTE